MSHFATMAHIWDSVSHFHSRFDLLHLAIIGQTTGNLP